MEKSREQLELEVALHDALEKEREANKTIFAEIRVQHIVYSACALILTAIVVAFVSVVVR